MDNILTSAEPSDRPLLYGRRTFLGMLTSTAVAFSTIARADAKPTVKVFKSPTCTCCTAWIEHLHAHGFPVVATDTGAMREVKARFGVPQELASCHTADIAGYIIEGHVPAQAIERLLSEKPDALGLAVPGMPIGSPGMEGGTPVAYDVILFSRDRQKVFARYVGDRAIPI